MSIFKNQERLTKEVRFTANVLAKAIVLFLLVNFAFAVWYPLPTLGRISAYNHLFPGRLRLPYGDNPERSYNLSLYNLEAMFASHVISNDDKPEDEFRVILIGDSSTWGFLLSPDQTLSAMINRSETVLPDGRLVRAYNLGYPVMSLAKDLLILSYAMRYQPDLIVWLFTLESFPYDKQLYSPLLQNNSESVKKIVETYNLELASFSSELVDLDFWNRTLVGARRPLADLIRLQFYGLMWAATGIDHEIPTSYSPPMENLPADASFHNLFPSHLSQDDLAIDMLIAGMRMAGDTPVLFVNEPMYISQGENSHIRYNFYYPRWAYDDYRTIIFELANSEGWHYLDCWDSVANTEFTNSAIHLTPLGNQRLSRLILPSIITLAIRP